MHELKKLIKEELHQYGKKKELCLSDVEPMCDLIEAYKQLTEICWMEEKEEKKKFFQMLGYNDMNDDLFDMQADGTFNFNYMSDGDIPFMGSHKFKNYNPPRVRPYRNMPERSDDVWGRQNYDSRMNRMDGMYDNSDMSGRYNDNRGRYVNMPEVYSGRTNGRMNDQPNYSGRYKGYDPSKKQGWKESSNMMDGDYDISDEEIQMWLKSMENEDGTKGAHWTKEQTTPLAKAHGVMMNEDVDETIWNLVMNIMYSDNCKTAKKYGVDKPDYYADLAKDWLQDEDGLQGREKVSAYYRNIVESAQ